MPEKITDKWLKNTKFEEFENAPFEPTSNIDVILEEFDRGDYSSMGLEHLTEKELENLRTTIAKGDELCKIAKLNNKHPQPIREIENEPEVTV